MSRFWLVVAALLGGAVLEIAVLWWLADTIGAGWTLLVLVISAVVGVLLGLWWGRADRQVPNRR